MFTIVPIWNDLWFPLILTSSDSTHTITLGVQQFLGQYITDWNAVLAALSLAILPVVAIYVDLLPPAHQRPHRGGGEVMTPSPSLRGAERRSNPCGGCAVDCFASLAMTGQRAASFPE